MARKQLGAPPVAPLEAATKHYVDTAVEAIELLPGPTGATGATGPQGASGAPGSNANVTSASVTSALGYTPESTANKAAANGYASLDSGGKVPVSQLPSSIMEYQGTYNASTNSPSLSNGTGNTGDVYRVSVAGTRNFGAGNISLEVGDYVIYNGSVFEKSDTTDAVSTVAGLTGDVTASSLRTGMFGTPPAASSVFVANAAGAWTYVNPTSFVVGTLEITYQTNVDQSSGHSWSFAIVKPEFVNDYGNSSLILRESGGPGPTLITVINRSGSSINIYGGSGWGEGYGTINGVVSEANSNPFVLGNNVTKNFVRVTDWGAWNGIAWYTF